PPGPRAARDSRTDLLPEALEDLLAALGEERRLGAEREELVAALVERPGLIPVPRDVAEGDTLGARRRLDPGERGLDVGMAGIPHVAEGRREVRRTDEDDIDAGDLDDLVDLGQRRGRLDLDDDQDLVVGPLPVLGGVPP